MARAKWYGEWVMHYGVYASNGNRWSGHIIIKADTFDDAILKVTDYCEKQSKNGNEYKATGTGYKLEYGCGCKW